MSVLPDRANFRVWKGATFRKRIFIYDEDNEPRSLANYTGELIIRDQAEGVPLLSLTTENDGIILTDGQIELTIAAIDTALIDWDIGVYDLTITAPGEDGDTDALLYGTFTANGI